MNIPVSYLSYKFLFVYHHSRVGIVACLPGYQLRPIFLSGHKANKRHSHSLVLAGPSAEAGQAISVSTFAEGPGDEAISVSTFIGFMYFPQK